MTNTKIVNPIYIETKWRSLNKSNEELCGDRVQIRRNDDCVVMVLADGLGSGVKANILSTLTSTIISEMMFAGEPLEEAVETIAGTLPVCNERGVAYSTFTVIQIFYDGTAYIAQFDNPSVVILRNQQLLKPEEECHTYNERLIRISHFKVRPGDCIVTFSDGVLHAGIGMTLNFGWGQEDVEKFLLEHVRESDPAREVCRMLLANVNFLYGGEPGDDSTVACIRVVKAFETRVMVGPPANKEDDGKVVRKLMSATGKKICCGGTTSEIVARVTGQELSTDLSDLMADVPPKGYISGVDLVTEGVLTLQKVSRMLARAVNDPEYEESISLAKETDGATLLAKALLESNLTTFMVGLSDNPAHDAIAYSPISLNAKIALIEELAMNLLKLGKMIHMELY